MSRVLVATDLSAAADEAVRQAHARASLEGDELAVCHVVPEQLSVHPLFPQRTQVETERWLSAKPLALEKITARMSQLTQREESGYELFVESGSPHAAILRVAEEWRADLIVVGNQGMSAVERILLGSVAERVIRYAHCPVLVARPRGGGGRIVVGTDFSDSALPAVAAAVDEAQRSGRKITIVHCLETALVGVGHLGAAMSGAATALAAEARREMEVVVDRHLGEALEHFRVEGDRRVLLGPAPEALAQLAAELEADLLVVGTTGRTGLRRVLLGSVAEAAARLAPCPVLVVRAGAEDRADAAG